jgi:hypothetical protein
MIIGLDPFGIASYSQVHIAQPPPPPPLEEWNEICKHPKDYWNSLCVDKVDNVKRCEDK